MPVTQAEEVVKEDQKLLAADPLKSIASNTVRNSRTATKTHRPIEVVTVDPQPVTSPDAPESAFTSATRVRILNLYA